MNKPFKFKQFTIHQDRCAMKVGTDGVLLGAWTSLDSNPTSILDIGAGTGLIALQLAQRSNAETIDAIELDDKAYEQCVQNFEESDWGDRLFCYHASLLEFADEIEETYDLIATNPPFYSEDVGRKTSSRTIARQENSMPFEDLTNAVSKLLSKKGTFATIIPFTQEERFLSLSEKSGLYPFRITRIKGTPTAKIKRTLLQFSFENITCIKNELVIEINRHEYTFDYQELTKSFYLKM
ncbi:tRNA1(Val) (adenine(37)-N6)-methyltransferase [Croceitalea rosinachiae]|uniref:tRNA1(Val) (adenine(37)-N6)-methyltransferase n=1 Tax=Croceitalea rosinachiae TaxID=3075596 RepID=A0ABU3A6P0_9FLAO|nr:methyltransferase [Croceitalea sp. F388]MDT0605842.1 methyltransferase [Croceitalea sp. F388]